MCPVLWFNASKALRKEAWARLESDLDIGKLQSLTSEIGFSEIVNTAKKLIHGEVRGRIIVDMKAWQGAFIELCRQWYLGTFNEP